MGDHASPGRRLSEEADALFPPRPFDPEAIAAGRRLFAREVRLIAAAADAAAIPPEGLPEIAFAGRSNVGKSSLINALCGRHAVARISKEPGCTRTLNFFVLGDRLALVDLPGYGYAEAAKSAVTRWNRLLRHYLKTRAALRRVCLLIDARHGIKQTDRPILRLLDECGLSYQVVLTKLDKLRAPEIEAVIGTTAAELARHPAAHPEIHLTSAREGRGVAALRAVLGSFAAASPSCALARPAMRG
jgi:GTP-binding protein